MSLFPKSVPEISPCFPGLVDGGWCTGSRLMMMHTKPTGDVAVFVAALILAPLVRGPWQGGVCTVPTVLHSVLTCCAQPATGYLGVVSLSTVGFTCSV